MNTDMNLAAARDELIRSLGTKIQDRRVLAAMARVPREKFVLPEMQALAYEDQPLVIGWGQTISQPLIIAMMTEALELTGQEQVLEVGTGSGYQTAVLAKLCRRVVTTERLPALAERARQVLDELGYHNIEIHPAGDLLGYPPEAPYDAILVTDGAPRIPETLLGQLAPGGRLVIPVGSRHLQELLRITRREPQNTIDSYGGCAFVPLVGKDAWEAN